MAVIKTKRGKHQVRVQGPDGRMLTRIYSTRREADLEDLKWKQEKTMGTLTPNWATKMSVDDYFGQWFEAMEHRASPGWRKCQKQFYADYVRPVLGNRRLASVAPQLIVRVLGQLAAQKKSEQTQLHVYNLLRKMFRDSVDLFQLMTHNPVLPTLKPRVPKREAKYLSVEQAGKLLRHVGGKDYDCAIWLQLYLGLRVSETIALTWDDVDLELGTVLIARSYSRKDTWANKAQTFRNRPKGGREHRKRLPFELWEFLKWKRSTSNGNFVATSPTGEMLSYKFYLEILKGYCKELEIPVVGTHGLRHSASELYLSYGASEDDIRRLFAHSSSEITERYLHNRGRNLERVAEVIRMFPGKTSTKRPREGSNGLPKRKGVQ